MRVGVTGVLSDLGRGLLPLLEADPLVDSIALFDIGRPPEHGRKSTYVRIDLTRPGMEDELTERFREHRLDVLFHLAFVNSRVHGASFAHELEVIGSLKVLAAAQAAGVQKLVFPSYTALYGARRDRPAAIDESQPLEASGVRFLTDRVEVEREIRSFSERNPLVHTVVLRFAPIVGPTADNPVTRMLRTGFVPTVLGFDPLWQVLHEEDAFRALHAALGVRARGVFNIVGSGVAPFSSIVRQAGARSLPLPGPALRAAIGVLEQTGVSVPPVSLLDFLRYSWVADGTRARRQLGFVPRVALSEALASMRRRGS